MPLPNLAEPSQPRSPQPNQSNSQSADESSVRPIYRNGGPSAALVNYIIERQKAQKSAFTSSAKEAMPEDLVAELKKELRASPSPLNPQKYVDLLLDEVRKTCPEAEKAFIEGAIKGLVEVLDECSAAESTEKTKDEEIAALRAKILDELNQQKSSDKTEQTIERAQHLSGSKNVAPADTQDDETQQMRETAIEASASVIPKTKVKPTELQQEFETHLRMKYFRPHMGEEVGDPENKLDTILPSLAQAFIAAGCNTNGDVDKMMTELARSRVLSHSALSGFAEFGFTASMMTAVFAILPNLLANMHPVTQRLVLGLMVGWGMTTSSEGLSAVRDNHVPQLKPTGIPAVDKLLPGLVKSVLIAATIATACTIVKNTPRIWASTTGAELISRQAVSNRDTLLDSFLSPLAAALASYLTNRALYPHLKTLMLAQKDFAKVVKNFNKPGTLQSKLKVFKADVKAVAAKGARAALAPSTLATTGFVALMVLALLSAKHAATEGFQASNPHIPADKMTKAEAATLGSISLVMMAVLTQLAPLIFSAVQHKVDQPIYNAYNNWRTRRNPDATPIEVGGGMEMTVRA